MDVLFHLPKEREDSGGRERREEQAADKEQRKICYFLWGVPRARGLAGTFFSFILAI